MDAAGYWRLSTSVTGGDLLMMDQPIAYRTPVYPWFIAAVRLVAGSSSLFWITAIQSLLSIASIWIAARLAARMTKLPSAMPLTMLVSIPAISASVFNATLLSEPLFVFLMMSNLSAVQTYSERPSMGWATWSGLTFAITLLTRPIVLMLWVPHVLFLVMVHLRRRHSDRTFGEISVPRSAAQLKNRRLSSGDSRLPVLVGHLLMAGGVCVIMVSPWLVRNQIMFGKPFLTEFVGRNLWVVTFQDGSGAGLSLPSTEAGDQLKRRLDRVGVIEGRDATWTVSRGLTKSGLSDPQTDRLMKEVAVEAIRRSPRRFAEQAFRRFANVWRTRATELPAQNGTGQFFGQQSWHKDVPFVDIMLRHRASNVLWINTTIMSLIGLATLVMVYHLPTRARGLWIGMLLVYFTLITACFEIPAYRYRMVLEPIAASVIGSSLAIGWSKRTRPVRLVIEPA